MGLLVRELGVQRVAYDRANADNGAEYDEVLSAGPHQGVNNVRGDEELQAEQKVIAKHMAEVLSVILDVASPDSGEFGANKSNQPAQNTEDYDENAKNADRKTSLVKIIHRANCFSNWSWRVDNPYTFSVRLKVQACQSSAASFDSLGIDPFPLFVSNVRSYRQRGITVQLLAQPQLDSGIIHAEQ